MNKLNLILLVAVVALFSCNSSTESTTQEESVVSNSATTETESHGQSGVVDEVSDPNALQLAQSLDDFSTLVAAVDAAGVSDALVNAGPLTVFAPLNSVFDKLPEGTVQQLLKPENKAKLAYILTNHVAPANYPIEQLQEEAKKGRKLYMASGQYLDVVDNDGKITVGGFEILKSVKVSNGWVHVIDNVIVPAE
ncbi:MAG: fasciclin domain-containing protein [Bacteroidetes bacterium]|nr:fasciclin domain-containing protein [Bacteroidota bacterium]